VKVAGSVRSIYADAFEAHVPLKERVDTLLDARKHRRWHYESRIKSEESFALKVESGRVADPLSLEDFFACTLVVENFTAINAARSLIEGLFERRYSRPRESGRTEKPPTDFRFDDLRMYVRWKADPSEKTPPFAGLTFEVQIKTFLQHAWGIATHDLVYKGNRSSWPLQRVAYQVKAMLEHAEVSIAQAEILAKTETLNLDSDQFERLRLIDAFLEKNWEVSELPADRRTLTQTLAGLLDCLGIQLARVEAAIVAETGQRRGTATLNLSPYGVIVQSLLNQDPAAFDRLKKGSERSHFRVFLPREIEGREAIATRAPAAVVAP
jgi:hypothetical protein